MTHIEQALEKYVSAGDSDAPGWGPSYVPIHGGQLEKVASSLYTPPELCTIIDKLRPRPEGRYILLHAIGAYEYWGANRNGDAFPEWSLRSMNPPTDVKAVLDGPVQKASPGFCQPDGSRYGCSTFVRYAHVYRGHANKDPLKACGDVIAAAYNDRMHRIELVVFVYKDRAPDVIGRIDLGEPVAWSMGAKLPFDVCSICGNVAKTRLQYCEHLQSQLGTVYPDGRKVFSYNYFPRFFDISEVGVPADRSAWTLKKVASATLLARPPAMLPKQASILKRPAVEAAQNLGKQPVDPKLMDFIKSTVREDYDACDELPDVQLMAMKRHGLAKSLAASAMMGIMLRPSEVDKLASSPFQLPDQLEFEGVDRTLVTSLGSSLRSRSMFEPFLTKRAARRLARPTASNSPRSNHSPAFEKYAKLIRSIDLAKWAAAVDSDPAIRMALDPDALATVMTGRHESLPLWLPFAVGSANLF